MELKPRFQTNARGRIDRALAKLVRTVDAFVPASCVLCRAPGRDLSVLCDGCTAGIDATRLRSPLLARADRPGGIDQCFAVCEHRDYAAKAVARLKFAGYVALARPIAELLVAAVPRSDGYQSLIPVPCGPARMRKRGFDQSLEIATQFGSLTGLPVTPVLRRGDNVRQLGSSRSTRRQRSRIALELVGRPASNVLLIDDVQTTGTTLGVAATALRAAGIQRVDAVTFTRSL